MKLRNLVFVWLALLTLATAITPVVHAEGPPVHATPDDLTVEIINHGYRSISVMMGVYGSDVYTLDGWERSTKYIAWQSFVVDGGHSVSFSYDFPNGKYTVDVAWTFDFYGMTRGVVGTRTFRTVDLHSDQLVKIAVA
jgi:hypothetical protein